MPQIIHEPNYGGEAGKSFSSGLQNAINMLAQNKLEEMSYNKQRQREQQQHKYFSNVFEKGAGYDPETSNILGLLFQRDPKGIGNILRSLGGGGYQQDLNQNQMPEMGNPAIEGENNFPVQQALQELLGQPQSGQPNQSTALQGLRGLVSPFAPSEQQPQQSPISAQVQQQLAEALKPKAPAAPIAKKNPSFANAMHLASQFEKPKSVAEQKHEDDIIQHKDRLVDTIQTANRMLQAIDKGASYGLIATGVSSVAPSYLDYLGEGTEQFDKDGNHLINLTSGEIKGVPSKYRVSLVEKEKPGVKHSPSVNKQILKRTIKSAEQKLEALGKTYPFAKVSPEEFESELSTQQQEIDELPTKFVGDAISNGSGGYALWDKSQNKYVPAQRKKNGI